MKLTNYSHIILTGANGWLGKRIVTALIKGNKEFTNLETANLEVSCLVPTGEDARELLSLGAQVIYGDINDKQIISSLLAKADSALVIHTAGIIHPPGKISWFDKINLDGANNLLTHAIQAGVTRMVVMSSNSPLGCNPHHEHKFTEESAYNPYMGYGKSKMRMELLLKDHIQQSTKPEITIIRAPWFYGPGQPSRHNQFFSMVKNGKFPIMGAGNNKRSMGYVDSLAYGMLLAGVTPQAAGEIYWLADEKAYSMLEIVNTVKQVLREDFSIKVKDKNLHVPAIIADIARLCDISLQKCGLYREKIHVLSETNQTIACDITKAKDQLGYKPLTDLRTGMQRSIGWCLDNNQTI